MRDLREIDALAGDAVVKRIIDVSGAIVGLTLSAPCLAIVAVVIKLQDGGPVLFRQERIGKGGQPFSILKLRTMCPGAEALGLGLLASTQDERITRIGRVLRITGVDELPQLVNVLRGEMSLVGPRPTVRSHVERYSAHERRRLAVRPGITGWAQILGRNTLSWTDRIELDIWYVEHRTVSLDLAILLLTVRALSARQGVYGVGGHNQDFAPSPLRASSAGVPHSRTPSVDRTP